MRPRASAVLIREDSILLIRRKNEKGEYYVFPGGGIEAVETPGQTVVREAWEEAGISIAADEVLCIVDTASNSNTLVLCHQIGTAKPVWQEEHKQTSSNSYEFVWVPLAGLSSINLLPIEGRDAVVERFKNVIVVTNS